jgi:hypothetical protein
MGSGRRARPTADIANRPAVSGHYLSSVDIERDTLTVLKLLSLKEQIFYVAEAS